MKTTLKIWLLLYIAIWVIIAIYEVGHTINHPITYDWTTPIQIFIVVSIPALLGYLIGSYPNCFKHRHKWNGTGYNAYGIVIEQKCKCGSYRHHRFQDLPKMFGDEPLWHDGKHPHNS